MFLAWSRVSECSARSAVVRRGWGQSSNLVKELGLSSVQRAARSIHKHDRSPVPKTRTASIISTARSVLGSMSSLAAPRAALPQAGTRCSLLSPLPLTATNASCLSV